MVTPASGVFKTLAYKAETTYGTVPAAGGAQALRRVTSNLSLMKDTFSSNEIRPDMQIADFRHGVRRVEGSIAGEMSPGTYADFFAASLRRAFTAGLNDTALSLTIAGTGPTYTVTRSAGDFTQKFKKGRIVRLSVGALNAANINKNLFIVNVTTTVLTVIPLNGSTMVAEGPIANCTVTDIGKNTYAPLTGHTNQSFSFEHWFSDVGFSEVFDGCQPTQMALSLPATGIATVTTNFIGQGIQTQGSQYFTSPTAASTKGVLAAVNGILAVGGTQIAIVTGMTMNIASPRTGEAVVGSNIKPAMYPGRIGVTGQITAYFADTTMRDAFIYETETDVALAFSCDNTATSDFIAMHMPRCKFGGASKNDGEAGIVQTLPFTALLPATGGVGYANEQSTLVIQDSAA